MAQVAGDLAFFISGHSGSFDDAEPLYVLNLVAVGAYFASAALIRQPIQDRQYADRNPPLWTHVAPYVPAVGMLAIFVAEAFVGPERTIDPVLLGATIIVGLLVIARQGVAIVDNRTHVELQRNALVSTISHELRTPLTAIVGFVDVVQDEGDAMDAAERAEMLSVVQEQADYMSRIVSDLILLARDSDSELELDIEPVNICSLVSSAVRASGVPVESVAVECPSGAVAFVDANRIQQILVNLLTNAMRYGGDRRLVRLVATGADLTLEVHDDGDGIPRRYEVQVWDRFDRGPNRLNASTPGSGIGLAIVRAIAEAHGGRASYSISPIMGGACFTVTLPGRAGYVTGRSPVHSPHHEAALRSTS
jgi:signal transduction histidine kinase